MEFPDFRGVYGRGCWPTQPFTALASMCQASSRSFAQDLPFELSEDRQQSGHCSTSGCGQIQRFRQRSEAYSEVLQFLECRQEVCNGAAPTVQPPPVRYRSPVGVRPPAVFRGLLSARRRSSLRGLAQRSSSRGGPHTLAWPGSAWPESAGRLSRPVRTGLLGTFSWTCVPGQKR